MGRLAAYTSNDDQHADWGGQQAVDLEIIALSLKVARRRFLGQDSAFDRLVHKPTLCVPGPGAEPISEVSFVREPAGPQEPYEFDPPLVLQGRVKMHAKRIELPETDWDY